MDGNGGSDEKKGMGRGQLIFRVLRQKQEHEEQTVAQAAAEAAQTAHFSGSTSTVQSSTNVPVLSEVPMGRGKTTLLGLIKPVKSLEGRSEIPPAPLPSQGRAAIFHSLKNISSVGQSMPQPVPQESLQSLPRGVPQSLPRGVPQSVPRGVPQSVPRGVPQLAPRGMPQSLPRGVPQSVPCDMPQSAPQPKPSNICGPSRDVAQMASRVSDLSMQESVATSEGSSRRPPISTRGTSGTPAELSANYINIKLDPTKGLYNYEVKFMPDIDSRPLRRKLLNMHSATLGQTKVFDGVTLYLPTKLPQDRTILESTHPMDGTIVSLTLIYKKEQNMTENITFFNVLLGRVMRALSLVRMGQHNFNPKGIHSIPQHKLEVWPGYVTAINEYEGGLKLCIDARHRVMRTETVREIMIDLQQKCRQNPRDAIIREIVGLSVFTRYNNKTYRVNDIDWGKNPKFSFDKNGTQITLIDYYKSHWNLEIKDPNQPLLVHTAKEKLPTGGTQEKQILLVPELCYIASLSDGIRSDFRIMKDLDVVTKINPNNRRNVLRHFVQEIQSNEVPREILAQWGLHLENDLVQFSGRVLNPEIILFGNNQTHKLDAQRPAEWSTAACRKPPLRSPSLNVWCVLFCNKDKRVTGEFVDMYKKVSSVMGLTVNAPQMIHLKDDRTETYVNELRKNIQQNVNLMVIVFPTNRTDRYSAVKKICCVDMPIPSQVLMSRTISRPDKLKSITEKIALQINCKLGGALWALNIPMDNCMICGIDVYHAGIGQSTKGSVAGFVASLDKMLTTWHSKVCLQGRHQELVDLLQICLMSALQAYYKCNGRYPDRIIIYRDGVGEGQLEIVSKYEVKQILATFKNIQPDYEPKLCVIVVHKRINTRLFAKCGTGLGNPQPGTVVDSCVTKRELYDFFLVSQNIRQGTVSPTHYIVVYDKANLSPDVVQRLTYKLCHLYYNWPGTIKVPAPCQYAHKLVSLVGQNIQAEPHNSLADSLYYL